MDAFLSNGPIPAAIIDNIDSFFRLSVKWKGSQWEQFGIHSLVIHAHGGGTYTRVQAGAWWSTYKQPKTNLCWLRRREDQGYEGRDSPSHHQVYAAQNVDCDIQSRGHLWLLLSQSQDRFQLQQHVDMDQHCVARDWTQLKKILKHWPMSQNSTDRHV